MVWATNDEAVAVVTQEGLVTAVAAGQAVVTVMSAVDNAILATCSVTVNEEESEG